MRGRDYSDILGGLLLVAIGLFAAMYASSRYEIGQITEMGPGMFPTTIGYTLAGLGVLIAIPAFFRAGTLPVPDWRPLFAILGGVLVFALTVDHVGMVPALLLLIGAAVAANDRMMKPLPALVLAVVIITGAVLLFRVGLGIPLPLFKWEF
jgi:hypothetical protein